jgi:cyclopropane fatty-acyl-phospholipid synthase-like methyltransferase
MDDASRLTGIIEEVIPIRTHTHLLDLACGRGRHSILLAKKGYRVTGIDLSEVAIRKAKAHARREQIKNVEFNTGDMRETTGKTFDAVVSLFTSFGYFLEDAENVRVLKNVRAMLKDEGLFLMDYLNPEYVQKNLIPEEKKEIDGVQFIIEREIKDNMVFKTISLTDPETGKPVEHTERVKLYGLDWFRLHMEKCGLKISDVYGNYNSGSFSSKDSPRCIMFGTPLR